MPDKHSIKRWYLSLNLITGPGILAGVVLYYFFPTGFLGGFGVGVAGLLLVGLVLFHGAGVYAGNKIEDPGLYLLWIPILAGLLLIVYNSSHSGAAFLNGLGCALVISGFLIFALELMRRFSSGS